MEQHNFLPNGLRNSVNDFFLNLRNRHMMMLDIVIFALAPVLAVMLRTDGLNSVIRYWDTLWIYIPLVILTHLAVYYYMGLYRRYWRYASVEDLIQIGLAALLASIFLFGITALIDSLSINGVAVTPDARLPRSIPIINALLILLLTAGVRFLPRLAAQRQHGHPNGKVRRVGIVGAGEAGITIVREIRKNPMLGMDVVCFFDDDPGKQGMEIHSVSVRGGRSLIPRVVHEAKLDLIILALPSAPGREIREIVHICQMAQVETKTIPGVYELIDGTVNVNQLRNIELNDLLRRTPVQIDNASVKDLLRGRRVLVTGGGGSIGRELCRQIIDAQPAQLTLLGHGENSIFEAQRELRQTLAARGLLAENPGDAGVYLKAVIADIRFADRIHRIFQALQPEIVFHAAAHKHVPLMEGNPVEAITNNVLGTQNVVEAAAAADVARLVMISTDKAVNPSNIMGASKRAAELVVLDAAHRLQRPYVAVRFGNVLGSRGSVVPIFQRQIQAGGPVTVTHPDIQRYFMTIPEAVQLVLQAAVLGRKGNIFVLDMGDPIRIADMAATLIQLSGYEVGRDIEIVYSGLRPGEKLYEELFIEGEEYEKTGHAKIYTAFSAAANQPDDLHQRLREIKQAVIDADETAMYAALSNLVPEYAIGRNGNYGKPSPDSPVPAKSYLTNNGVSSTSLHQLAI
ncbi:MAG: polysaccharide biosynthesis protein [Caldilineaceae bacterium]|nr:polysaccharide biosynthesis protein [Caldilineaceae bacterium]